ncbi:hypothetical protein Tco_1141782, partial [Tanacetum coccineum]
MRGSSCHFIGWYDPAMCTRSTIIISGLLRSKNEVEVALRQTHEELRATNELVWKWRNYLVMKRTFKSDLADLDLIIDKGCGDVEIVNKRANVVRSLQELENLQSL